MNFQRRLFSFFLMFSILFASNPAWPMDLTGSGISTKSLQVEEVAIVASLVPEAYPLIGGNIGGAKEVTREIPKSGNIHKAMGEVTKKTGAHSLDLMNNIHLDTVEPLSKVGDKWIKSLGKIFTLGKVNNHLTHKRDGVSLDFSIIRF